MFKLASIPPLKMPARKRPSNFIASTFDPQQQWQTKMGKGIILTAFFLSYLIFFALFLYFNIQWKGMEFEWTDDTNGSCAATVSMVDFIGDVNTTYYCFILVFTVALLSVFLFKKDAVSSHIYVTLTILATVTVFLSISTITIYALGNGWSTPNCTTSKMVDHLNHRLIFQTFASIIANFIFIIICYHLHKKAVKLNSIIGDNNRRVYSISPPEFVSSFPPPPPYYSTRQTC